MTYGSSCDPDFGVTIDYTGVLGEGAVLVFRVDATASAVDVAAVDDSGFGEVLNHVVPCQGVTDDGIGFGVFADVVVCGEVAIGEAFRFERAARGDIHQGVVLDVAVLAASEDRAGDVGGTRDVDDAVVDVGEAVVDGAFRTRESSSRAEYEAVFLEVVSMLFAAGVEGVGVLAAIGADGAAVDGDSGEAGGEVAIGGVLVGVANRGEGSAAVDVAVDGAAGDSDVGVAGDLASGDAVGSGASAAVCDLVNASSAAVDVAAEDDVVGRVNLVVQAGSNSSVLDLHVGVVQDVAVLTAAEYGAVNGAAVNGHIRLIDVGVA